jgi:hypothetical protein
MGVLDDTAFLIHDIVRDHVEKGETVPEVIDFRECPVNEITLDEVLYFQRKRHARYEWAIKDSARILSEVQTIKESGNVAELFAKWAEDHQMDISCTGVWKGVEHLTARG